MTWDEGRDSELGSKLRLGIGVKFQDGGLGWVSRSSFWVWVWVSGQRSGLGFGVGIGVRFWSRCRVSRKRSGSRLGFRDRGWGWVLELGSGSCFGIVVEVGFRDMGRVEFQD